MNSQPLFNWLQDGEISQDEAMNLGMQYAQSQGYGDLSEYTVAGSDNLSLIAEEYYGDQSEWTKIYEANQEIIGNDPNLIHSGQELIIPDINSISSSTNNNSSWGDLAMGNDDICDY